MFTPKEIERALSNLFNLLDPEDLKDLHENFEEEIADISSFYLAKKFNEDAETVHEYRVVCSIHPGMDYYSKALFNQSAVKLLSNTEYSVEDELISIYYFTELWLLEDMTFTKVHNLVTLVNTGDDISCVTEYRSIVTNIEENDDIFFYPGDLICQLDDFCMLALLKKKKRLNVFISSRKESKP